MKKQGILTIAVLSAFAFVGVMEADAGPGNRFKRKSKTDFAMFDATNPNNVEPGALCLVPWQQVGKPWNYHVAVTNNDASATRFIQVVYKDGDFVRYHIPPKSSFAMTQSAGHNPTGVAIRVFVPKEGQISGVVSAQSLDGTRVKCMSCDNDSDGPAACDAIIPFNG